MGLFNQLLTTMIADAGPSGGELAAGTAGGTNSLMSVLIIIVPLAIMYLILILPQRKKEKKQKELINSAEVGDQIVTIGGMAGKIVNIKDDEVTFETSVERSKITIKRWAIRDLIKSTEA